MKKKIILSVLIGTAFMLLAGCKKSEDELISSSSHEKGNKQKKEHSEEEPEIIEMPITFVNNTGTDIYCLYSSPSETDDWEEDILGDEILEPGDYVWVDFTYSSDSPVWDFAIEDYDRNKSEFYDLDFEDYGSDGVTIVLNNDGVADLLEDADSYETVIAEIEAQMNIWKDTYKNYISANDQRGYDTKYSLIYIDEDDIPELYIDYGCNADGCEICTINSNMAVGSQLVTVVGDSFGYLEGQNLFSDSNGSMDVGHEIVYTIENGQIIELHSGTWEAPFNDGYLLDEEGNIIYTYYWDGYLVSGDEYWNSYYSVYNQEEEMWPYDSAVDKNTIIQMIDNM